NVLQFGLFQQQGSPPYTTNEWSVFITNNLFAIYHDTWNGSVIGTALAHPYGSGTNFVPADPVLYATTDTGHQNQLTSIGLGNGALVVTNIYSEGVTNQYLLNPTGDYFPSNTWNLAAITTGMTNGDFWIGNSNGQALVSVYLYNGVAYVKQLAP
ncbi:MAG: hypothetical protein ACREIC_22500, partial [Limisphaerales bacterium]